MWCLVRSTCGVVYVYIAVFACERWGSEYFFLRARRVCMCSVVLMLTHAMVVPPMAASTSSASPSCGHRK